jgi:hypothetical protein
MKKSLLVVVLLFFTLFSFSQQLTDHEVYVELRNVCESMNASCPYMLDSETRLDNLMAFEPKTIQYNGTLVNYSKSDLNVNVLKANLEPTLVNKVRTTPELGIFREYKVTISYYYYDKYGQFLFSIIISPDKYGTVYY